MLPGPALLLKFLAERSYGRPVTAGRPLRDHGQARLWTLGAGVTRCCKRTGGTGEHGTTANFVHCSVSSYGGARDRRQPARRVHLQAPGVL